MRRSRKDSGQSFIEYLMVMVLIFAVYQLIVRANLLNLFQGDEGIVGVYNRMLQNSYRHGLMIGEEIEEYPSDYSQPNHKSYKAPFVGQSRFFAPDDEYPKQ